ncbi:hypothetical protein NG796_18855 [Laspinema sp. A4]|uniref:hypothetical protein n=1 Tax=Laspinema sp. D2d TaxID=2953686 RepID=UPI0021BB02D6|nr:hypothetical protein [Laspinema sp. D2d]MCT7985337.1 hypothetical protein [Laspinema sp. D2d]
MAPLRRRAPSTRLHGRSPRVPQELSPNLPRLAGGTVATEQCDRPLNPCDRRAVRKFYDCKQPNPAISSAVLGRHLADQPTSKNSQIKPL